MEGGQKSAKCLSQNGTGRLSDPALTRAYDRSPTRPPIVSSLHSYCHSRGLPFLRQSATKTATHPPCFLLEAAVPGTVGALGWVPRCRSPPKPKGRATPELKGPRTLQEKLAGLWVATKAARPCNAHHHPHKGRVGTGEPPLCHLGPTWNHAQCG